MKTRVRQYKKRSGIRVREHRRSGAGRFVARESHIFTHDPRDPLASYLKVVGDLAHENTGKVVSRNKVREIADRLNHADQPELMELLCDFGLVTEDDMEYGELENLVAWSSAQSSPPPPDIRQVMAWLGSRTSKAKKKSSRENGKLGGRPPKKGRK